MNIRNVLVSTALVVGMAFGLSSAAGAVTYTYVGSWQVDQGPYWGYNPPVYTGQQAAALLFGGSASDYAISTVDSNPADINFKTWLDGWADPYTYAYSGTPAAENYSLDTGGGGYNSNPGYGSAYSAYVSDHGVNLTNYAFSIAVPEPATWAMMLFGFGGLGAAMRSSRRKSAAATA